MNHDRKRNEFRQARPELAGMSMTELLAQTAMLPGTNRLALVAEGRAEEIGELLSGPARLAGPTAEGEPETDVVGAILDELGFAYKRREAGWYVQASARCPQEISLTPTGNGGLRVEAVLASWEEIGDVEKLALARFLCRAQVGLRFARCELQDRQAVAAALLFAEEVESGLGDVLLAVQSAVGRVAREASALLAPDLAAAYVSFFSSGEETPNAAGRI